MYRSFWEECKQTKCTAFSGRNVNKRNVVQVILCNPAETCKQHDMGVPAGIFLEYDRIYFVDFVKRFYQEFPKQTNTYMNLSKKVTGKKIWK